MAAGFLYILIHATYAIGGFNIADCGTTALQKEYFLIRLFAGSADPNRFGNICGKYAVTELFCGPCASVTMLRCLGSCVLT